MDPYYMSPQKINAEVNTRIFVNTYFGSSIDQEIEREIAMQWVSSGKKNNFSQRNFLLKKECL